MKTQVEKIILKYYNPQKKNYNPHNWEKCGNEIQNLIRDKSDKIRSQRLSYSVECKKEEDIRNSIESEYESFFGFRNINGIIAGYDWINGNEKLKKLINSL